VSEYGATRLGFPAERRESSARLRDVRTIVERNDSKDAAGTLLTGKAVAA
jgi:hypothetical protein